MTTPEILVIAVLLLVIIWFVFMTSEAFGNLSANPDKYGNAIAQTVKRKWHYNEFRDLVKDKDFDPTMFDTLFYFQSQNWLSKPNLIKILKADYTNLDRSTPNAY